jgi:Fe-Mn family superoxide dismutase
VSQKTINDILTKTIKESLERSGALPTPSKTSLTEKLQVVAEKGKAVLKEAFVVLPKNFHLGTEWLSSKTKKAHDALYQDYAKKFNQISAKLDSASREEVEEFRNLKKDFTYNLNAVKLHELYFGNISDLESQVHRDSIPFMRLSRDWGSFENWQFDFIASALSSREGWVLVCYDPFKDKYMNVVVDGHSEGIPLGAVPVIVLDMWSHAYYADFQNEKQGYVNAMMRELNWSVIEARMVIAERSQLKDLYLVRPLVDNAPTKILDQVSNVPPIGKSQISPGGVETIPAPASDMQVNPRPAVGAQQNKVQ